MSITITIVQNLGSNKYMLRCARCNGTGVYKAPHECSNCNGRGVLLVQVNGEIPFVACARCGGTGVYKAPYECSTCDGTGAQPIRGSMKVLK